MAVTEPATRIVSIDSDAPDSATLQLAADVIRRGGLVAFPTETVYGLGANALDPHAVERIFIAKSRPTVNPLIVHVSSIDMAKSLTSQWLPVADTLAEFFWPGPLTLVLPKSAIVPDLVTAGGSTVAIRMPIHRVALGLIQASAVPLAAPSANRSTQLSPTRAEHVMSGLDGRIDLILDGGPTPRGIESTVIDLTTSPPTLLRPGPISMGQLQAVIGDVRIAGGTTNDSVLRSPGQMARHYSPRTPVELHRTRSGLMQSAERRRESGERVAMVVIGESEAGAVAMPANANDYATRMYQTLYELDDLSFDRILIELPPDTPEWLAIRDRLLRSGG